VETAPLSLDTKDREGGYFTANFTQWTTFLNAVKPDRFTN
jgi:hypothetical protein